MCFIFCISSFPCPCLLHSLPPSTPFLFSTLHSLPPLTSMISSFINLHPLSLFLHSTSPPVIHHIIASEASFLVCSMALNFAKYIYRYIYIYVSGLILCHKCSKCFNQRHTHVLMKRMDMNHMLTCTDNMHSPWSHKHTLIIATVTSVSVMFGSL